MINLDISKLRNAEYYQFTTDFVGIVKREPELNSLVAGLVTPLETGLSDMEAVFNQSKTNLLTFELGQLDGERDTDLHSIEKLVEVFCNHYTAAIADAAKVVALHLTSYGDNIAAQNYNEETANIHNLVDDFAEGTDLKAAADQIPGLPEWLVELKRKNDKFHAKYLEREAVKGDSLPYNMKSKRAEMDAGYKKLIQTIEAYAVLQADNDSLQQAVQQIETLLSTYKVILKQRQGRKKKLNDIEDEEI